MEKLAVVILNFNGVEHLKKHLTQIIKNKCIGSVVTEIPPRPKHCNVELDINIDGAEFSMYATNFA